MKYSYYNHIVREGNVAILYNALQDAYMAVSGKLADAMELGDEHLPALELQHPKFYQQLQSNGYIVDDGFDEVNYYKNLVIQQRFSSNSYEIIINPTLDCNLRCWYCYEQHVAGSAMSDEMIERVIKHAQWKHSLEPYRRLTLGFFGGEPLLQPNVVAKIINGIAPFAMTNGIDMGLSFTTNGTQIDDGTLELLKCYKTTFQITIDGDRDKHNQVRFYKANRQGSYEQIMANIGRIASTLSDYSVVLRVNYDVHTLQRTAALIDDLAAIGTKHMHISLHKVWQVEQSTRWDDVFALVEYTRRQGIDVQFLSLAPSAHVCYADQRNEMLINYNGDVYKCTACDFSRSNAEGKLLPNGSIEWDAAKLWTRLTLQPPKICSACNFLPSCPGICSQNILEHGDSVCCTWGNDLSKEDYIIYNFNRYAFLQQRQQKQSTC